MASTRGRQVVVPLTNKSGGAIAAGDVVIVDTSNNEAFTTTTTGRAEVSLGVAQEAIASNAIGRVLVAGYAALVNVPASVTRGHYVETHTVAKQATGNSTRRSGSFGQFLTGGTTPTAMLWGATDQSASATANPVVSVAQVGTAETRANAAFGDLATPGPSVTVTVPASGKVRVTLTMATFLGGGVAGNGGMGVVLSGANTVAASVLLNHVVSGAAGAFPMHSRTTVLTGLTPGSTTFKAQYNTTGAGTTVNFSSREILVEPVD